MSTSHYFDLRKRWSPFLNLKTRPTRDEIALMCGCTKTAIEKIEIRALRRMRAGLERALGATEARECVALFANSGDGCLKKPNAGARNYTHSSDDG